MIDKKKSEDEKNSAGSQALPEEKADSPAGQSEEGLKSLKESLGIMKKAGERLGKLRKGEFPEQRQ